MLQTQTIEPRTLSVLKTLMEIEELNQFSLVGGTALSLKYGHRLSNDLDLFSVENFEREPIIKSLEKRFGDGFVYRGNFAKCRIFCQIENIKVDIVHYPHEIIEPIQKNSGIRLYHDKDLIAMKIQAILGRGVKKDFWDIAELMDHYSLEEMITYHKSKFPNQMLGISIPYALTYFADADESDDPETIIPITWRQVKAKISKCVSTFLY